MAKVTNHFQRTKLITSSTDKHYSLDSEDDFGSGCRNVNGSMVLVDETLYVFGGHTKEDNFNKVECYNHASNEWNVKATVPVDKITILKYSKFVPYVLKGCSIRVFKGVLTNLESI